MTDISNLYRRFLKLKSARAELEPVWRECYEFALPQREGLFSGNYSQVDRLFDGTAPDCVDQLSACIFSEMTPPWTKWFSLKAGTEISNDPEIDSNLNDISDVLYNHLNASNFCVEMHQCFLDLTTVGTACLMMEESKVGEKSAFRFSAIPLCELFVDESPNGRLDTTFRYTVSSLENLIHRFEKALKADLSKLDNKSPSDVFLPLIECVVPKQGGGYAYTAFIEKDTDALFGNQNAPVVLKEGVFEVSPFITFRWQKVPGEIYGRSPVMKALPDIKTANKVVELILKNATIAVTGIWQAEDDGVLNPANIRLTPGTIIPKAVGSKGLTPLQAAGDFDVSQLVLSDLRTRIRHALLNDKLGQVDVPKMTATEVLERSAEMVRILGATYGRLQSELLTPLIERAIYILHRRGQIPDIYLDGRLVGITYQSPIASTQANQEARKALDWLSSLEALKADVATLIDAKAFASWLAGKLNIPTELIKTEESQ
ncbi:MAG: portal protein [Alphaproteobacteria bacterium]